MHKYTKLIALYEKIRFTEHQMGLSITARLVSGGEHKEYPLYVWFADFPDGPVWSLIDNEFDQWDEFTGPDLAFFVDPFHKEVWAREFLNYLRLPPQLTDNILQLRKIVQRFYRRRLAENLSSSLWLSKDILPIAIVATSWDSFDAAIVNLSTTHDVKHLFESLVQWTQQSPYSRSQGHHSRSRRTNIRHLARYLHDSQLSVRLHQFGFDLTIQSIVDDTFNNESISLIKEKFLNSKIVQHRDRRRFERLSDRSRFERPLNQRNFAIQAGFTVVTSLDDILDLSSSFFDPLSILKSRYPNDIELQQLSSRVYTFNQMVEELRELSTELEQIANSGVSDDKQLQSSMRAFESFSSSLLTIDTTTNLLQILGTRTYSAILHESRSTIGVSEIIYKLSRQINELHRDMTSILLGYWKAVELESSRVLDYVVSKAQRVHYKSHNGQVFTLSTSDNLSSQTMGSLAVIFSRLFQTDRQLPPGVPLKTLGKQLNKIKDKFRNKYTHGELLEEEEKLHAARFQVGCGNQDGLLHTAVDCLEHLGAIDVSGLPSILNDYVGMSDVPERPSWDLDTIIQSIEKNNASTEVPKWLNILDDEAKMLFSQRVVGKLKRSWLLDAKRQNRDWVTSILAFDKEAQGEL